MKISMVKKVVAAGGAMLLAAEVVAASAPFAERETVGCDNNQEKEG